MEPTLQPTDEPTIEPTGEITPEVTETPQILPTEVLTEEPTIEPTVENTVEAIELPIIVPLYEAPDDTGIPNQFIVIYKEEPGVNEVIVEDMERIRTSGGEIIQEYKNAVLGYTAILTEELLNSLRQETAILLIEQDQKIRG